MTLTELYRIAAQIDAASFEAAEDGQLAHAHALHEIAERIRRDAEREDQHDWGPSQWGGDVCPGYWPLAQFPYRLRGGVSQEPQP